MRVMIVGQKWLAAEVFSLCRRRGDDIAAVCAPSAGDRLAALAAAVGVPAHTASTRLGAGAVPDGLDLLICAHAHAYIDGAARAKTRLGAIGYHPSLLPRHRGRDAIRWAIHMGDKTTGGTVYWMDDGADTGPIARQDWCWVQPGDTAEALWRRELAPMGIRLFEDTLADIDNGVLQKKPQLAAVATWEPALQAGRLGAI